MKHVVDPGIEEFIYNIYTFTGEVIRKRKFRRLAVFRSSLAVLFFGPGSFFSGIRTNDGVQRVGSKEAPPALRWLEVAFRVPRRWS